MRAAPPPAPPAFPRWLVGSIIAILLVGGGVAWIVRSTYTSELPTEFATPIATAAATPIPNQTTPLVPATEEPLVTATPTPRFLAMAELVYARDFTQEPIDAFLRASGGDLADVSITVAGRRQPFAKALLGQTLYYSVSPKIILALLEYQADLVTQPGQPADRYQWAVGNYQADGKYAGFSAQIRWAVRELFYARRDLRERPPLVYADGTTLDAPTSLSDAQYVLARVLAPTIRADRLEAALWQYQSVYERLFGQVLAAAPAPLGPPTITLQRPLKKIFPVTSFFDHGGPFLTRNLAAGITTYWGHTETDMAFAYNGHDGWDYAAAPPDEGLAAAAGTVIFAGVADDNCDTLAVIIDHGADVRTLYWHLSSISVEMGQRVAAGDVIGVIGETGCAKGPHLHFGVQYAGVSIDPYGWCGQGADPWQNHPAGAQSYWMWAGVPSPCGPVPAGDVLVDSADPAHFTLVGVPTQSVASGVGASALYVAGQRGVDLLRSWRARPLGPVATAEWHTDVPKPGRYRLLVYVPYALSGLIDSDGVSYQIIHRDGVVEQRVNLQTVANEWVDLGTYTFDTRARVILPLRDAIGGRGIWADALLWQAQENEAP
ncbi:MAG: hypothetical protein RLY87_2124 [Chloroflexota bacterium]